MDYKKYSKNVETAIKSSLNHLKTCEEKMDLINAKEKVKYAEKLLSKQRKEKNKLTLLPKKDPKHKLINEQIENLSTQIIETGKNIKEFKEKRKDVLKKYSIYREKYLTVWLKNYCNSLNISYPFVKKLMGNTEEIN